MPPKKKGKGKKNEPNDNMESAAPVDDSLAPSDREILLQKEWVFN